MSHGVNIDMTPKLFGGEQQLTIENQNIPMNFDGEKLFFNISKPTQHDMNTLEAFKLTSPYPLQENP